MVKTAFIPALKAMEHIKSKDGKVLTKPFLDVCNSVLAVLDEFEAHGFFAFIHNTAMDHVKEDIKGNIEWLEDKYKSHPREYNHLYSMIQAEVRKTPKGSYSVAVGLLWLTRAMDFLVELFRNLSNHRDWSMDDVCEDSYKKTLEKWHGFASRTGFKLAMGCAPDKKKFLKVIGCAGDHKDMKKFCSNFTPILEENHKFLARIHMNNLKAS